MEWFDRWYLKFQEKNESEIEEVFDLIKLSRAYRSWANANKK